MKIKQTLKRTQIRQGGYEPSDTTERGPACVVYKQNFVTDMSPSEEGNSTTAITNEEDNPTGQPSPTCFFVSY